MPEMIGEYTCEASNAIGNSSTTCKIIVSSDVHGEGIFMLPDNRRAEEIDTEIHEMDEELVVKIRKGCK
jgi:hypothetical protein